MSEAQKTAEDLGGNLVSINSQREQDFIVRTFLSEDDGQIGKWIGLTDKGKEEFGLGLMDQNLISQVGVLGNLMTTNLMEILLQIMY